MEISLLIQTRERLSRADYRPKVGSGVACTFPVKKKRVKLCQVWVKVLNKVSRATQTPCGQIVPNKRTLLRGHTDRPASSGSRSMPSYTEEYGA
ncbi:hypothetical protein NQZ68_033779 [Dissostichus eleginoides]|nr:hypothetical protein NQZ68_033779 [Dissostichus eleginoides]